MTDFTVYKEKKKAFLLVKQLMNAVANGEVEAKKSGIIIEVLSAYAVSMKHVNDMITLIMSKDDGWHEDDGIIWFTKSE